MAQEISTDDIPAVASDVVVAEVVPPSYPRRHDLDALRAFAMLLGIALHAALSFAPDVPWITQDSQQNGLFSLFILSVHGFRMPLFFVVSGFFTAMLWRRRGLASLLKQRAKRILLPLLLGFVTVVPALTWVSTMALSPRSDNDDSALLTALRTGDLDALQTQLTTQQNLDARDSTYGVTPIAWASMLGNVDAVAILMEKGADVNGTNRDGGSALHGAAFFGRSDVVELLIDHGADIDLENQHGHTAYDSASTDWGVAKYIAGLLSIPIDKNEVLTGRVIAKNLLSPLPHSAETDEPTAHQDVKKQSLVSYYHELLASDALNTSWNGEPLNLVHTPFFHHLWFLWFLCWLIVIFAVYATIADWFCWQGLPRWLVLSPARVSWLFPLTLIPQCFMLIPSFGPDTSAGVIPQPHMLVYYGIFFGFGALYFDADDQEGRLGRWWWLTLPLAILVALPCGVITLANRPVSGIFQIIFVWAMTFGLIGLFRQFLSRQSRTIRYVSDSSYWLYLTHLPLIVAAQFFVAGWSLWSFVKFTLICSIITGLLLIIYQLAVRYTWLGTLLNGPRQRPVGRQQA